MRRIRERLYKYPVGEFQMQLKCARRTMHPARRTITSRYGTARKHYDYANLTQTGIDTRTSSPILERCPIPGSIRKVTILFEFWLAETRYFPVGSIAKPRGSAPPVEV